LLLAINCRFINNHLVVKVHVEQQLGLILFQDVDILTTWATASRLEDTKCILKRVFKWVFAVILTLSIGTKLDLWDLVS
jgi:hypothetical protein